MRRFFGRGATADPVKLVSGFDTTAANSDGGEGKDDVLYIQHAGKEFTLTYPFNAITSGTVTVGAVRESCAQITGVEKERIALSCSGRGMKLKDDGLAARQFGIGCGAKILCITSKSAPPPPAEVDGEGGSVDGGEKKKKKRSKKKSRAASPPPPAQQSTTPPSSPLDVINALDTTISATLSPLVDSFTTSPPPNPEKRADVHRRLTETLMAELLKLDEVECADPEVRARRKEVVRGVQGLLDRLDGVVKE